MTDRCHSAMSHTWQVELSESTRVSFIRSLPLLLGDSLLGLASADGRVGQAEDVVEIFVINQHVGKGFLFTGHREFLQYVVVTFSSAI